MSGHLTLPPLPDCYADSKPQLIHIQPIGYEQDDTIVNLSVAGAHAFQVWIEVPADPKQFAGGWDYVPSMEKHFPLLTDAEAYAWALAAKYGVQVQLHDED